MYQTKRAEVGDTDSAGSIILFVYLYCIISHAYCFS